MHAPCLQVASWEVAASTTVTHHVMGNDVSNSGNCVCFTVCWGHCITCGKQQALRPAASVPKNELVVPEERCLGQGLSETNLKARKVVRAALQDKALASKAQLESRPGKKTKRTARLTLVPFLVFFALAVGIGCTCNATVPVVACGTLPPSPVPT